MNGSINEMATTATSIDSRVYHKNSEIYVYAKERLNLVFTIIHKPNSSCCRFFSSSVHYMGTYSCVCVSVSVTTFASFCQQQPTQFLYSHRTPKSEDTIDFPFTHSHCFSFFVFRSLRIAVFHLWLASATFSTSTLNKSMRI